MQAIMDDSAPPDGKGLAGPQVLMRSLFLVEGRSTVAGRPKPRYRPAVLSHLPRDAIRLIYTLLVENKGNESAYNLILDNRIPDGTTYVVGSAVGENCRVLCSTDGGSTYHDEDQQLRQTDHCTDIRWLVEELPAGQSCRLSFQLHVNEF